MVSLMVLQLKVASNACFGIGAGINSDPEACRFFGIFLVCSDISVTSTPTP